MRRSVFSDCDFKEAKLQGAILTRDQARWLTLDERQSTSNNWTDDEGDEPAGV